MWGNGISGLFNGWIAIVISGTSCAAEDITPYTKVIVGLPAIEGHFCVLKTYQRSVAKLYWAGMKKDVEEMLMRCDVCQYY